MWLLDSYGTCCCWWRLMFSACKFWWNLCNDEMREGELQLIGLQLHPCMYCFQEGVGLATPLSLELCSGIYSYSVHYQH